MCSGIKGIWEEQDPKKILDDWNHVYYMFSDALSDFEGSALSAFSDSFIISIRGNPVLLDRPWRFVEMVCNTLLQPFQNSMRYGFFFRGVMVLNAFSRSPRMLIGPAVDEAAQFHEKADWIGISISPTTQSILQSTSPETPSKLLVKFPIPQKQGSNLEWAVNWPIQDKSRGCWRILNEKASMYRNDPLKFIKYKNTIDFYSKCINVA
jgi:hypothetical protein